MAHFYLVHKINIITDSEAVKYSCKSVYKRFKTELMETQKTLLKPTLNRKLSMQATNLCEIALCDRAENPCVNQVDRMLCMN